MIPWHRLLGLALMDYFHDTGWRVDVEKDLALQRQLLDVLIIETGTETALPLAEPCDGFEALRPHNLLTYKSHHEPLDVWAVEELIGHYVNSTIARPWNHARRRSSLACMRCASGFLSV